MNHRHIGVGVVVIGLISLATSFAARAADEGAKRPPNVVIILTDDQGYADLGCYGSFKIKTPRIDRMAAEGTRFTDFYAPAPVCTPTRAGLLTGCHPQRLSLMQIPNQKPNGDTGHVMYPLSRYGLNPDEVTIAEVLKARGYVTGMIGKWHLGDMPEFNPTRQGFDSFFGTPYSNDMKPAVLLRGEKVVEDPMDQDSLIDRYTDEAVGFINSNKDKPFFLYFAHNMPHRPLHVAKRFKGKSERGLYGDAILAVDWSVGRVLDTLKEAGVDNDTLVVFTSDNGPWLYIGENGGSAFPLRGGKGTTFEGGMRIPFIARWPGHVPAGTTCREPLSHLDLLPTIAALTGAKRPERKIDGADVSPILLGQPNAKNPHEALFYYSNGNLLAVRAGRWKYKDQTTLQDETEYGKYEQSEAKIPPALYDLELDPTEQKNVANNHSDIVERMKKLMQAERQELGDRRLGIEGKGVRPRGEVSYDPRAKAGAPSAR
jgi:arylsulfatase A-like enzyme